MNRLHRLILSGLLFMALAVGASSCAYNPFRASTNRSRTSLEVVNNRWEDLIVYLQRDGSVTRLGPVSGKGSSVFQIADVHIRPNAWISLFAGHSDRDPHARSAVFSLARGENAFWEIPLTTGESPVFISP